MASSLKPWFVYIVQTANDKLYTGITTDPDRRLTEHQTGKGAKYFRSDVAVGMVYLERCCDRSEASKREAQIKKMSAQNKRALILSGPQSA